MAEICRSQGVGRGKGYRWKARYGAHRKASCGSGASSTSQTSSANASRSASAVARPVQRRPLRRVAQGDVSPVDLAVAEVHRPLGDDRRAVDALDDRRHRPAAQTPSTVLRCAGIYGPGRTRLIDAVRQGTASMSGRCTNRIHRDDIAGAILHLMAASVVPATLLLSDDEPAPQRDVTAFIAARLGVPLPAGTTSDAPARGGDKRCNNARLHATGYALLYPTYREGYSEMLAAEERR